MAEKTDEEITGDVTAALAANPHVRATAIKVRAEYGWVRLEGVVDTLEMKTLAEKTAREVIGVKGIENNVVIASNGVVSDRELTDKVQRHLVDSGYEDIGAKVEAGVAFLMGVVSSLAEKERVVNAASEVQGIRDTISNLEIAAGEPVDDIKLSNDVAEALSVDNRLEIMDLDVKSEDGLVFVMGQVTDEEQIDIAYEVASAVPGVKSVNNRLKVY